MDNSKNLMGLDNLVDWIRYLAEESIAMGATLFPTFTFGEGGEAVLEWKKGLINDSGAPLRYRHPMQRPERLDNEWAKNLVKIPLNARPDYEEGVLSMLDGTPMPVVSMLPYEPEG